ncbi:MAG: HEAT repeat domain-containing protein [Planctomycetes bacterium]|nr:HEAT repeat domain-containing protein [Planctomycetota bacterium]
MKRPLAGKRIWIVLLALTGLGGLAWWQHKPVLAWHYVGQLAKAGVGNREAWAAKVAGLDEVAWPDIFCALENKDVDVCANMEYALVLQTRQWAVADPRTQHLVVSVQDRFARFSQPGQEKILMVLAGILRLDGPRPLPPRLTQGVSEVLIAAEKNPDLRASALVLAGELVACGQSGQWVDICRDMAQRGLAHKTPATRVAALRLLMRTPMRGDQEALAKAIPFLRDPDPGVRHAALLALASAPEVAREDMLLFLLHDDNPQVQELCRLALRKRGLGDADIQIAWLIGHKDAARRMRVLQHLDQMPELNLTEWLRRLSHDSTPAVRAAAVRAIGENRHVDLARRLREMAAGDASPTVRQNAQYYLALREIARATVER